MFNWFKKKNKDEENKKVQEEKIDILTEDADAAQINEDAHENEKINFNQDAQSINQNLENEEKVQEKPEEVKKEKTSFFKRMFSGLEKTRQNLNYKLQTVFKGTDINDDFYDELEEVLVTSDIGVETVMNIIDNLKERIVRENVLDRKDALPLLKDEIKNKIFVRACNDSKKE